MGVAGNDLIEALLLFGALGNPHVLDAAERGGFGRATEPEEVEFLLRARVIRHQRPR